MQLRDKSFVLVPAAIEFAPTPLAANHALAANAVVTVTLTAKDATGAAIANASVYLSFTAAAGGGTAKVGTTTLSGTPSAFVADDAGHVSVTYTATGKLPASGIDTVTATDTYNFAP